MSQTIALMLETDGPGGAEVFLVNSAIELRERGCRVIPLLPVDGAATATGDTVA
jgi:hypothetical protein